MLILSRRPGESILIGDGIRLVVIECDRRGVRLGIEAPPEVTILRGEIVRQIEEENLRASASGGGAEWLDVIPVRKRPPATGPDEEPTGG